MELDDLKQGWKNEDQLYKRPAYDLNGILAKKADDPLNSLKMKYKKQLVVLPLVTGLLIVMGLIKPELQQSAFIWLAIVLLLLSIYNYYRNYKTVLLMQEPEDISIRERLETYLSMLQRSGTQQLQFLRLFLVLFIAALEWSLYYSLIPAYQEWQQVMIPVRITVYAVMLLIQPYLSKYFFNLNFGRYISRLQDLLDQAA